MAMRRGDLFARTPEDCDRLFAQCVKARDLDGLIALYVPKDQLIERDGSVRTGHDSIRGILASLTAALTVLDMNIVRVHEANGVAVLHNDWRLRTMSGDETPIERAGHAIEIVQRQPDDRWLFAIDDPFGSDRTCR